MEFLESRRHRVEDYEDQLDTIRVQDAEEYNMVKIKLETDVQVVQLIHVIKCNVHPVYDNSNECILGFTFLFRSLNNNSNK